MAKRLLSKENTFALLAKSGAIPEVHVRDLRERSSRNQITVRDAEVLKLLAQGCSNNEIARQLKIRPCTVKQHLRTNLVLGKKIPSHLLLSVR